jgi:uncharacterized membrane protein
MQNKEDQLWKEYAMLREEIKSADTLKYQITGIAVGAVGAILVASFNQSNFLVRSLVALCAYIVTIPAYEMLIGNMRRTWRITTYMRVFLEADGALDYIRWETRMSAQREKAKDRTAQSSFSSLSGRNEWLLITMLNSIAAIIALFSLGVYAWEYRKAWIVAGKTYFPMELYFSYFLIAVLLILSICLNIHNHRQEQDVRRGGRVERNFYKSWLEIKNPPASS